jgi:Tfp pilus assembly PilM family ATPase
LLTRTIEQGIGLDAKQAEQYKRTYGLDEQQFEGKIRQLLIPPVKIFINEMMKASQFFISQYPGESIKRILLCGGTAQLPGLVQFVTAEMGAEVLVAAPFAESTGQIPQTNHPSFSVCMGLIMREVI